MYLHFKLGLPFSNYIIDWFNLANLFANTITKTLNVWTRTQLQRLQPHPFVGDPLVAEPHRATEVEDARVVAADGIVIEPVEGAAGFCKPNQRLKDVDIDSY